MGKLEDDSVVNDVVFDSRPKKATDDVVLWEIECRLQARPNDSCALSDLPFDLDDLPAPLARLAARGLVEWAAGGGYVAITLAGRQRVAAYRAIEAVADGILEATKSLLPDSDGHVDLVLEAGLASEARRLFDNAATAPVLRHALALRWVALDRQKHRFFSVRWMDSMSGLRIYLDYDTIVGEARANRHVDFVPLTGYPFAGGQREPG